MELPLPRVGADFTLLLARLWKFRFEFMNDDYHELQTHLASYLTHIAKIGEARTLQIMFLLKTEEQVLTIMEYIEKHKDNQLDEEHLLDVAIAISEQVK